MRNSTKNTDDQHPEVIAEERQRISRELHDRVLQLLSSARLRAESSRRQLLKDPGALEIELHAIEENIDKAITEIRNLISDNQNAEEIQPGSLERRLKQELEIFRARTGFKIDFHCAIRARDLPPVIETELYFTLREGILNAVRHSRATEVHLALTKTGGACEANLRDNGVGFDPELSGSGGHYGLKGMKERIRKIGGELTLNTAPGKGTEIKISVPFESN